MYSHPSLFEASKFAVSQIRGVAPRIQTFHSDTSMDKSIKIVPQLDQVLMPNSRTFKELKEKQEVDPYHSFLQRKERHSRNNILKHSFFLGGGGSQLFADFHFSRKANDGVGT